MPAAPSLYQEAARVFGYTTILAATKCASTALVKGS